MSAKAYSFLSLLFSTQRNVFGKLSLSEYRVTGNLTALLLMERVTHKIAEILQLLKL